MKLSEINNIESWVMRITRNQCYDWVKVNRFSLQSDRDLSRDDLAKIEPSAADESIVVNDQLNWLQQVVDSLPAKHREIYQLREVEEMTYQDIAEILSMSFGEVKISLHRTRQKIRNTMEKIENYGLAN